MEIAQSAEETVTMSFIGIFWPLIVIAIILALLLAFALSQGFSGNPTNLNPTFSVLPLSSPIPPTP